MSHVYEEHSEAAPWERSFVANSEMSQRYSQGRIKPLGGISIVKNLLGIDGFSMFTMCITTCEVCVCVTMFLLKYECVCNTVSVDGFSVFITTCPIYRFIMSHYILEMCDHSSMLRFWHRHEFWLIFTLLCLKHEVAGQKHVLLFSLQKFMLCMHCTVCMQCYSNVFSVYCTDCTQCLCVCECVTMCLQCVPCQHHAVCVVFAIVLQCAVQCVK